MGGGSEFPAELVKALLNGVGGNALKEPTEKDVEKRKHNEKDRKQGRDTKIKERDSRENKEKKEKVIKVKECSKVDQDKRQPASTEVAKYMEENRRQIQSKDKRKEERKDREEERKKQKEVVVNGCETGRSEDWGKVQDMGREVSKVFEGNDEKNLEEKLKKMEDHVKSVVNKREELAKSERETDCKEDDGKALETLEGIVVVKDEKKHKEGEKRVKQYTKKDKKEKKEVTIPEGENDHGIDELLDKNLTPNDKRDRGKDKGRYSVEKLKKKLAKLDKKMEKLVAKSESYLLRLKQAEESRSFGGEIVDNDEKLTVDSLANKVDVPSVPFVLKTGFLEMATEVTSSKSHNNISERILYPKLEEKDITGAGY